MPQPKTSTRARRPGADTQLAKVTVARFEESLMLVERIASDERQGFLAEMQKFREEHRQVTRRPLTAEEATRFAAAMADAYDDERPEDVAARLQGSDLYAYGDPSPKEVLVAAGLGTAPALSRSIRQFVALMEMDEATFVTAYEDEVLAEAIAAAAKAAVHSEMEEYRARARAAFAHWAAKAGVGEGEAMRSLIETVWGALENAALRVTAANLSPGLSHLSTSSPEPTAGPAEPSSTISPTGTP